MSEQDVFDFLDLPDVLEQFADSLAGSAFDQGVFRVTFCVTRTSVASDPQPKLTRVRVPTCRLALTPQAAIELHHQLSLFVENAKKQGFLKQPLSGPQTKQ